MQGRVTHRETKEPIANALVIVGGSAIGLPREVQTNEHGQYAASDLPPGTYFIQVLVGDADVSKVTTIPPNRGFVANFSINPDEPYFVCRFGEPTIAPDASLFSLTEAEARLLRVPPTEIHY